MVTKSDKKYIMSKMKLWCLAVSLWCLVDVSVGLQVDCFIDRESKVSCRCFGFDRDTVGQVRARLDYATQPCDISASVA